MSEMAWNAVADGHQLISTTDFKGRGFEHEEI